jgi:hypothetical protein
MRDTDLRSNMIDFGVEAGGKEPASAIVNPFFEG